MIKDEEGTSTQTTATPAASSGLAGRLGTLSVLVPDGGLPLAGGSDQKKVSWGGELLTSGEGER